MSKDWPIGTPDERTTAVGLYHYARSYHDSARVLDAAKVRTTHAGAPVQYLYYHSIELFLKAYLRLNGHTVEELETKFRHHIAKMRKRCAALGMAFMDEDLEVLDHLENTDLVIRSRYIATGPFRMPTFEAIERTAASLRQMTAEAIRKSGTNVRG